MKNTKTSVRPLNMEERRKLEKIMFDDIDQARRKISTKYQQELSDIKDTFTMAQEKLLAEYQSLQEDMKAIEKKLEKDHISLKTGYGNKDKAILAYDYGHTTPEKKAIRDKEELLNKKLEDMKRNYTLKLLFAGGEEAIKLFETLGKELQAILNS